MIPKGRANKIELRHLFLWKQFKGVAITFTKFNNSKLDHARFW